MFVSEIDGAIAVGFTTGYVPKSTDGKLADRSCLAESCEVLTLVRYEVVRAKTIFQLFFCSLNNFTSCFRFLSGAGIAEDMRAELKFPHAHPITINMEESSREEAIEAG